MLELISNDSMSANEDEGENKNGISDKMMWWKIHHKIIAVSLPQITE